MEPKVTMLNPKIEDAIDSDQLSELVRELTTHFLEQYHQTQTPPDGYRRIIDEIERTLFATTMKYTFGNQSKAAIYLGLNRATLRSKLKRHGLME